MQITNYKPTCETKLTPFGNMSERNTKLTSLEFKVKVLSVIPFFSPTYMKFAIHEFHSDTLKIKFGGLRFKCLYLLNYLRYEKSSNIFY